MPLKKGMIVLAVNIKQIKGSDNLLAQAAFVQNNLNGKISYENGSLVLSVPLKTLQQDVSEIDFSQMDDSTLVIKKYVDDNIDALKGTATAQGDTLGELEAKINNIKTNAVAVSATADYNTGIRIGTITINGDDIEFMINLSDYALLASPSFSGAPTAPTPAAGSDNTLIATTAFVQDVKEALQDSVSSNLNTLKKIADAINNDPDYHENMLTRLTSKVNKSDISITGSSGNNGTVIGSIVYDNNTYTFRIDLSSYAPLNSPAFTGTPTAPTADQGTDTAQIATTAFVNSAVSAVKGSPPANLNTLQKLASAVGNDAAYSTTVNTALGNKQPLSAALTSISGLTTAADKMIYTTAANTYKVTSLTEAARNLLDDADAAAMRATLDVPKKDGTGATGTWNIAVTSAGTATTATNATNDDNGDKISTTYLKIADHQDPDLTPYALASSIKQVTVTNTLATGTRVGTITVGSTATDINVNLTSYAPLASPTFTGTPTAPTVSDQDDDSTKIANTAFVAGAIRRLVGTTLEGLDTLQELAAAINNDPTFATTIANSLNSKQDKNDALTSISGLTTAANKMIYTRGSNVYAVTDLTEFARSILDDGSAAAVRATIDALGKSEKAASATTADSATTAVSATNATNATNDADGNPIKTTYVKVADIKNLTAAGNLSWISAGGGSSKVISLDTLALWNGRYNSTTSNLAYCNKGAFGTIVTHNEEDYLTKTQADSYYMAAGSNPDLTGYLTTDDLDDVSVTTVNTTGDIIGTISIGSNSVALRIADITGNAGTATTLATSRNINLKDADSTNTGTGASFNGSSDITLKLPATIKASLTGNADTATALANARDINISDSTGVHTGIPVSFDGTANKTIKLPSTIDASVTGNAATASELQNAQTIKIANSDGTDPTAGTSFKGNTGITLNLPSTIKATLNGNAASATKATQDGNGKTISDTYATKAAAITELSSSGTVITYTKGNGDKGTIATQDTHYTAKMISGSSTSTVSTAVATNGSVYLRMFDNNVNQGSVKVYGGGAISVTSPVAGEIYINAAEGSDVAVAQTAKSDNVAYPLLAAASATPTSGAAAGAVYNTGITINPSTRTITAATFNGNAATATNATNDDNGNQISTTYAAKESVITGLSADGTTITYTKGNGTTGIISTQDSHYTAKLIAGLSTSTVSSAVSANGSVYLRLFDNNVDQGTVKVYGGGGVSVTSPVAGQIYISADANTDTAVVQTSNADNVAYPLLAAASASPTSGAAAGAIYNTGITVNPSTKTITATTFNGNATSATKATNDSDNKAINTTYFKLENIHKLTAVNNLDWASSTANSAKVVSYDTLALWNGRYNSTASNLAYCNQGAFGDIVTHAATDFLTKTQADGYYMAAGATPDLTDYVRASDLDDVSVTTVNATGDLIGTVTLGTNSVNLRVATAPALTNTRTVDGVQFNGDALISHYAQCTTGSSTANKTVTISGIKGYTLETGSRVTVKFINGNTAANPTLSVNGTTAKPIYYRGYAIPAEALTANCTYDLVYDGTTSWDIVGSVVWAS